jgi:hypothetical protein
MRFTRAREDEVLRERPDAHIVFPERAYESNNRIRIYRDNGNLFLHRYLFTKLVSARLERSMFLLRQCAEPLCQNPLHYEVRASPKGEAAVPTGVANAVKTHCHNGHPFTPWNTRLDKRGKRVCRTCDRERDAERRAERKAS